MMLEKEMLYQNVTDYVNKLILGRIDSDEHRLKNKLKSTQLLQKWEDLNKSKEVPEDEEYNFAKLFSLQQKKKRLGR